MKRFAVALLAISIAALAAACSSSRYSSDPSVGCGAPGASNECRTTTQPRLILSFGDAKAAGLTYTADTNGELEAANLCPNQQFDEPGIGCDAAFYGYPGLDQLTLTIADGDAGTPLATRVIALSPFNYCGDGAAHVVVTTVGDGTPVLGDPTFVDICSHDVVPY